MPYKGLAIFIEGEHDDIFFCHPKIKNKIEQRSGCAPTIRQYAEEKEKGSLRLKSLKDSGRHCILVVDQAQESDMRRIFKNIPNVYIIVIKEIESWFLAGLTAKMCERYKLPIVNNTESIRKEDFDENIKNSEKLYILRKLMEEFNIDQAKQRNNSFKKFAMAYL